MMMLKVNIVMLVLISVTEVKMRKMKGIDPCIEHKHFKMDCEEDMGNRMPVKWCRWSSNTPKTR